MLCLFSPLMSIDTSFVSIYLRKWISQSGWVALSKVSLKPPLTPFSSSFPKDSSILVQETSGFHQRANTWILSSFRVEALGQSLLGVYRLPCVELWDAGIRSVWHCMDQNQTLGARLKADTPPDYSRIASDHPAVCSFPRRKKVQLQLWRHEQMQSLGPFLSGSCSHLVTYTTGQRFFLRLKCL